MIRKYITAALLSIAIISLASCDKLLEVEPESQITDQVYFQSEGDFAPYVTGIYVPMRTFANNLVFGTERSEELINAFNSRLTTAWSQILSPTVGAVNYSNFYSAIGHCNLLLEKIKPFQFSNEAAKNRIMAEAYCQRAYFYFYLLRVIGDTPLMLQAITDENVPLLPRAKAADVMKQVISDLNTAISLFPEKTYVSKYRFSYASAHALKAEASLWSAKVLDGGAAAFNDAVSSATEVEASGVQLLSNFREVNTVRTNNEVILSAYFQRDETNANYALNALPFLSVVTGAANLDSIPYAATSTNGLGSYQISTKSRALFSGLTTDKRVPNTFIIERQGTTQKYAWITRLPGNKYVDDRISDNDVIIFRLADVFLIKAEAYAGLNNTGQAIEYLNKVRLRAGIGVYTGDTGKPGVERAIFDERGRELFFENKRWYDIVRFHKGGTIDAYTYVPNLAGKTTPLFWPLATAVLAANTSLDQTDGY
ncbi:MAG TPA: RagB/SusD family nutrient uptake outer membrane protein [Pedobacter sp.]|uniref:RagB/SusD family nutrient uptake outer membrane protein n=1 Tax=Pedobacter sp. TaxID=1411316 RepID=UPI002C41111C|nr:RagB/SusD family nutrient uptake outer membrane protein [Pedobacter sp.]HMI01744.1 RagB/SusD family nutrient uptake outer membrane protein [Pedobacter sp.]